MTKFAGSQIAPPGLYFDLQRLRFNSLDDEARLPGSPEDRFIGLPIFAMLVVGPLIGLAFVIFMPLITFAMVTVAIVERAWLLSKDFADASLRVLEPSWEPARAFLSRHRRRPRKARPDSWERKTAEELDEKIEPRNPDSES